MNKIYTEKGKNYLIKRDKTVKTIKYNATNDIEIQDTLNKDNTFDGIRKISKYEYVIIETGEVKKYKRGNKRNIKGVKRSMKNVRRLLKNNFSGGSNELFITLTTKKDGEEIKQIKKRCQAFLRKLKRVIKDLEYLAVFEKHSDRNSWHIHMLVKAANHTALNIPNSTIEKLWGYGFTKTSAITNIQKLNEINEQSRLLYKDKISEKFGIDKVISYMCKAETKEEIPNGEICYIMSKGIKKPTIKLVKYDEIRSEMENKYKLKNSYTSLVRNSGTNAIVNKVKTEVWHKNTK